MTGKLYIGIDLGGTNCRGALIAPDGSITASRRIPTPVGSDADHFIDVVTVFCREFLADVLKNGGEIVGVGMGAPGVIGDDGTVHISPNLPLLNGVPLAMRLEKSLGLPVRVVNDASAVAWGEALWGAGRSYSSFIALTLGTGVGGGLVLNRRLWKGADGAAGEVGHLMVEPEGLPCGCGSRGCLEQYASATGMVRLASNLMRGGRESILSSRVGHGLTSEELSDAAREGDAVALHVFREAGIRLGQALAGIANLLNLDGAVITGGASASLDLILPSLEEELFARAFEIPARRLKVVRGELGDDAGILGAGGLCFPERRRKEDIV